MTSRSEGESNQLAGALQGLRVVDFSQIAAGPLCTMLLADMGADVIKVEPPAGDIGRTLGPPFLGETSAVYLALNRNKHGVIIDLKSEHGLQQAHKLIAGADILVESFRPGVAARLGIGFEVARKLSPRLVYCSVSAYGQAGPWSGKPGVDGVLQAVTGLMSITGCAGDPSKVQAPLVDMVSGYHATIAILAGIRNRDRLARPIDVNLFAGSLMLQQIPLTAYLGTGELPERCGSGAPYATPNEAYATADGHMLVAAYQPARWVKLCETIGRAELAVDPRFATLPERMRHRPALTAELEASFRTRTTAQWLATLEAADIICANVATYEQVMGSPQIDACAVMTSLEDGRNAGLSMPGFAIGGPAEAARLSPPEPGQHNHLLDLADPWSGVR